MSLKDYSRSNLVAFLAACTCYIGVVSHMGAVEKKFFIERPDEIESIASLNAWLGVIFDLLAPIICALCDKVGTRYLECGGLMAMGWSLVMLNAFVHDLRSFVFVKLIYSVGNAVSGSTMAVMFIEFSNSNVRLGWGGRGQTDEEMKLHDTPDNATFEDLDLINEKRRAGKQTAFLVDLKVAMKFLLAILGGLSVNLIVNDKPVRIPSWLVGSCVLIIDIFLFFTLFRDKSLGDEDHRLRTHQDGKDKETNTMKSMMQGFRLSLGNPILLLAYGALVMELFVTTSVTQILPMNFSFYFLKTGMCDMLPCETAQAFSSHFVFLFCVMGFIGAPIVGKMIDGSLGFVKILMAANIASFVCLSGLVLIKNPPESGFALSVLASGAGITGMGLRIINLTILSTITSQKKYFDSKGCIMGVSSLFPKIGDMLLLLVNRLLASTFPENFGPVMFMFVALSSLLFMALLKMVESTGTAKLKAV